LPARGSSSMRLGITSPMFTMTPNCHAPWEEDAQFDDVVPIVEAADRLGYEYVTCSEHVIIPNDVAAVRGGRYWDPLATFGYLAARTERIRFATYVLVLGYHHPLEIAKRYGTLDRISGGRLILGVGVGSPPARARPAALRGGAPVGPVAGAGRGARRRRGGAGSVGGRGGDAGERQLPPPFAAALRGADRGDGRAGEGGLTEAASPLR